MFTLRCLISSRTLSIDRLIGYFKKSLEIFIPRFLWNSPFNFVYVNAVVYSVKRDPNRIKLSPNLASEVIMILVCLDLFIGTIERSKRTGRKETSHWKLIWILCSVAESVSRIYAWPSFPSTRRPHTSSSILSINPHSSPPLSHFQICDEFGILQLACSACVEWNRVLAIASIRQYE